MITDGILQNALEQHRQFLGRFVAVFFRELEHRILNDVQRRVIVAHGKNRMFICAALDAAEKLA